MKQAGRMILWGFIAALFLCMPLWAGEKGKAAEEPRAEGAGYYFIRDDIGLIVDGEGCMSLFENEAIKLLNKKGLEKFGQLVRIYDANRQSVEVVMARTITAGGKSLDVPLSSIQEKVLPSLKDSPLYSHVKMKVIQFPDVKPGCTVEYHIKTRNLKPYPGRSFWETSFTQDNGELSESSFFCGLPEDRKLYYFTPGYRGLVKPHVSSSGGRKNYYWNFRKVAPVIEEVAMPSLQELASKVLVSSFATWNEVGSFFNALTEEHLALNDEIRDRLEQNVGKATDAEKVKKIYAWLSRDKEIVDLNLGVGGYTFHNAVDIFKEKTVTSRDFAVLLLAMLREEKIEAYPVLVCSPMAGGFCREIPSIQQFDNVLIAAYVDKKPLWLEPLGMQGGVGDISSELQGRPALLVRHDSSELVDTPRSAFMENREEMRGEFRILPDNSAEGNIKLSEYGVNKLQWLKLYQAISDQEKPSLPRVLVGQINPDMTVLDYSFRENSFDNGPFTIQTRFRISNFIRKSDNDWSMKLPLISSGSMRDLLSIDPEKRIWPVVIGSGLMEDRRVHVLLPEGFTVKRMPKETLVENRAGSFQVLCSSSGPDVNYYIRLAIRQSVIPREDAKALVDLLTAATKAQKETIIIEKRKSL